MHIRLVAGDRTKRSDQQRQRKHERNQPSRNTKFDDHHPVERADHQGRGEAHRELEQGQAQQTWQRQTGAGNVSKRQPADWHLLGVFGKGLNPHVRNHSIA